MECILHLPNQDQSPQQTPSCKPLMSQKEEGFYSPVKTINNKTVTRVYFRKILKKGKSKMVTSQDSIFGLVVRDFESHDGDLNQPISSLKRKGTPLSVANLRRSKRSSAHKDGFNPSPLKTPSKASKVKTVKRINNNTGKPFQIPTKVDFPDLTAIDKYMNMGLTYPEIPIHEIQRVARDVCGVHPSETSTELLQAEGHTNKEGSNQAQLVPS
jgi:hypothetical protein